MKITKSITFPIIISIIGLTVLIASPKPAAAVEASKTPTTTATNTTTTKSEVKTESHASTEAQTQKIQSLKTRADTEISKRLKALDLLTAKVNKLKKLSSEQKTAFIADIHSNITELTNLKTKIDADTDPTTLQSDVKSIINDYRIFAVYVPKIHLLAGADVVTEAVNNLNTLAAKLQVKSTAIQQTGKDISTLQALLADIQTRITNASTQAQNINTTVISLTPSGYPNNINTLQNAEQMLKTAQNNIQIARSDAQQIINNLKSLQK